MSSVHLVVPVGLDDPDLTSGGNRYDRELADALPEVVVTSRPDDVPSGATVLLDGLVAQSAPEAALHLADRTTLVVLAHMVFGTPGEARVLARATGVVATSAATRMALLDAYGLDPTRVHVASPGVAPAPLATGTRHGLGLLSVATVVPDKGHDLLLDAVAGLPGPPCQWSLTCVGSLSRDPSYADGLRAEVVRRGLADRVRFTGVLTGARLAAAYGAADLLVHAPRHEGYGMVLTEALARGIPVLAADVGGTAEAVGEVGGRVPGLLVPVEDPEALGAALQRWTSDPHLRRRWADDARLRRTTLTGWGETARCVEDALRRLSRVAA